MSEIIAIPKCKIARLREGTVLTWCIVEEEDWIQVENDPTFEEWVTDVINPFLDLEQLNLDTEAN